MNVENIHCKKFCILRYYLKKCKGGGYWGCERCIQRGSNKVVTKTLGATEIESIQFKRTEAPLRKDEDFLTYYSAKSKNVEDNHCSDRVRPSPFYDLLPIVRGFAIDPMHTVYPGNYGRRLIGFRSEIKEGKISVAQLKQVDDRILLFQKCKPWDFDRKVRPLSTCVNKYKHHELRNMLMYYQFPVFHGILDKTDLINIMRLQKGMLLLGGSQTTPVPNENITEASAEFKTYSHDLEEKKIPIRYMTHATIHIPEDVKYFKVGVERNAAWVFETFQMFVRKGVRHGNKICEQVRNRLMERFLYLLPSKADGSIITNEEMFEIEVAKHSAKNSNKQIVVDWNPGRGHFPTQILTFPDYSISNKFPNNVLLLRDASIVVCTSILKNKDSVFQIRGMKFEKVKDAFKVPYVSSRFNTVLASKLGGYDIWNVNAIRGKMFACPFDQNDCSTLPNIVTEKTAIWFVTPIRHTLNNN